MKFTADDQKRGHEDDAQQGVEIALHDGFIGEPAKPRQREDAFDDDRTAQHGAGLKPDRA